MSVRRFCFLARVLGGVGLGFAGLALASAAEKKPPEVLVVADAKISEPTARIPTAEQPTYYYFLPSKERDLGHPVAGEKMPSETEVKAQVEGVLAAQHFLRTEIGGHKPDLFLLVVWGVADAAIDDIPDDGGSVMFNKREMQQLLGVGKANRHNNADPFENDQIREAMEESRIYVSLGAFDAEAMAHKQKKLVWRTSMSVDSAHQSLPASLATMLISAAPYIGHETEKAYQVDEKARRNGKVDIGQLKVIRIEGQPTTPAPAAVPGAVDKP